MNTNQPYGKVAVLMGGLSAERAISLKSGQAVLAALQAKKINAVGVDVGKDILQQLQAGQYDRAFNMLHGRGGEDGVIQGALEILGLPYTGSNVLASALGMDKLKTKEVWIANQLPTPAYYVVNENTPIDTILEHLSLPLIIKPMREGSSIGMSKVNQTNELPSAILEALKYDSAVLVEQWIDGEEYTVGIVGDLSLPAIRLETSNTFYDYDAKYSSNETQYHCPCGLTEEKENRLKTLAMKAFNVIGASDWGRIDMMVNENGEAFLIEINTLPGMTDHSLLPMAGKQAGMDFNQLVLNILEQSMKQR